MAVDKSDNRVRQMFGAIAPAYDRMNHLLSLSVDRYWRWRTVRIVRPEGREPILDVCTGTGDLAFAFARTDTRRSADCRHRLLSRDAGHRPGEVAAIRPARHA